MSSVARPQREVKKWRVIVFVIVGGLLALLALYAGLVFIAQAKEVLRQTQEPGQHWVQA